MDSLLNWWAKSPKTVTFVASGAVAVCLWATARVVRRRRTGPRVANYEKDKVYMFNFPSCRTIVSVSPFGLKLETWLRLHKIPHTVTRKIMVWSQKGQIPFVELNGQEYNESNLIIAKLTEHFGVKDNLTDEQEGLARGLEMMLENQTVYSYFYYRYVEDVVNFINTWEFCGYLLRQFLYFTFPRGYGKKVFYHGIGRNSVAEMYDMGFQDIMALSRALGNKQFLFGDEPTTADCYAFGHLAQILYIPINYPHKKFMRESTPNLCEYVDRMKERFWPDWDKLSLENLQGSP
ncbi:hypothetical protein BOX15_Mlig003243g4 [Macrostomum lignano]|uniref:Uncharacterized protein n=2 Tax=Macrostomum lignano TaxID=282301 RepID=A0A267H272_9PLAT|nr:hypothetical protein BOX15_Mlig003243g1 [Macrostomum lignano]PAA92366.1 hypothetical protein BOX15_Mlig003243g4 [Macrostomum lignano]